GGCYRARLALRGDDGGLAGLSGAIARARVPHLAVAVEEHALLHDHHWRLDVALHLRGAAQLDPLGREHVADDLAVDQDDSRPDGGVDDSLVTYDEAVGGGERVLSLDLRSLVDEGREIASLGRARALFEEHVDMGRAFLPRAAQVRGAGVVGQVERALAVGRLVHLRDVAVEESALRDDKRIGRDVAGDPTRLGDLDVAGRDHVARVVAHDGGVHRLDVGADAALLADDELAADRHLAADLALDLDRVRDVELALHAGPVADDREQLDRCRLAVAVLDRLRAAEHRALLAP